MPMTEFSQCIRDRSAKHEFLEVMPKAGFKSAGFVVSFRFAENPGVSYIFVCLLPRAITGCWSHLDGDFSVRAAYHDLPASH